MRSIVQSAGWWLFGLGVVACAGSSGEGTAPPASLPLEDVPRGYAEAVCAAAQDCYGDVYPIYLNGEDCVEVNEAAIADQLDVIEDAIAKGRAVYDGTQAQACFDAIAEAGCNPEGKQPEACEATLKGAVAEGDDCELDAECAGPDSYCRTDAACPGECAPREGAGSACERDGQCARGLTCSEDTQRCVEPAAAGDRCGGGSEPPCQQGLFCLGDDKDKGVAGNCRTLDEAFAGAKGDTCVFEGKPLCQPGLFCVISVDATAGVTTACAAERFASGAACKPAFPDACPDGEYCAIPSGAYEGSCEPRPEAGEACGNKPLEDVPEICAAGTRCDGGTCRARQALAGSCEVDAVCLSNHCVNGECAPDGACE
jgi:hypothetical protein